MRKNYFIIGLFFLLFNQGYSQYYFQVSSIDALSGGQTYQLNEVSNPLSFNINYCAFGNSKPQYSTQYDITWYVNSTNSTVGSTMLKSSRENTLAQYNLADLKEYYPSTSAVGTYYYYAVLSNPSATSCGFQESLVSTIQRVDVNLPATHLNFDGVDDKVVLSNESNFDFTTTFSMECWIKVNSFTQDWQTIISKGELGPRIDRYNNTDFISFGTGPADDLKSIVPVNDGKWHHIAATCSNGVKTLYIDGALQGTQTVSVPLQTNDSPVIIGSQIDSYTPIRAFNGDIDDVRIWNVARTAEQISGAKNCELQGNETGLLAYYKFNQGLDAGSNSSITTLTDATSNANNGTLTNFDLTGATSNFLAGSPVTTGSIIPSQALVVSPVEYVKGATATALTATIGANGTSLVWYTTATAGTGTTAPTPSTVIEGATSYWVSSVNANGCESERVEIIVNVNLPATHLNFDGVDDYVDCGNKSSLQITGNQITLEAYVKFNSFGSDAFSGNIINKNINSSGYLLRAGANGIVNFVIGNNGYNQINSPANSISLNTWHHIAGVYDGVDFKIYVDGIEVVSNPLVATIGTGGVDSNISLGRDLGYSDRYLDGALDEVRIWNVARTAGQISGAKNCELQGNETGLLAYYKFNQGLDAGNNSSITTLTDATTNANNGTLTNFNLTGASSNFLAGSPISTGYTCVTLSASNFEVSSKLKMYPNPTTSNITIDIANLTNVKLQILDITGKVLLNKSLNSTTNSVDISKLPNGIYLFKANASEGSTISKIIKK